MNILRLKVFKSTSLLLLLTVVGVICQNEKSIGSGATGKPSCLKLLNLNDEVPVETITVSVPKIQDLWGEREFYNKSLFTIRDLLDEKGYAQNVDTVLYAMAGHDSVTPAILFPKARTIVAIDDRPFLEVGIKTITAKVGRNAPGRDFLSTGDMSDTDNASLVVGRLAAVIQGFRLRKVYSFNVEQSMNGVVEFDTGPNTPRRRYYHIQSYIDSSSLTSWWFKALIKDRIDALLVKASTGAWGTDSLTLMRTEVTAILRKRQGVIVNGDEFPISDTTGTQEIYTNLNFGYSSAKIIKFN